MMAARLCSRQMRLASFAVTFAALLLAAPAVAQDPPPPLQPADVPDLPPSPADTPPTVAASPAVAAAPPAVEPPAPTRRDDPRTLKGHAFRPPLLLDSAFVTTFVDLSASVGRQVTPGLQISAMSALGVGHVFAYDATQSVVTGRIQGGVRLGERVEVDVDGSYTGSVVGDQNTALLFGGQSAFDVRPGIRFGALRSPGSGTALGLRAYGAFSSSSRLSPARVLADITRNLGAIAGDNNAAACLQTGDLTCALGADYNAFAAMRISRATYGGGVAASLAQAFGSRFGLQATTGFELARGSINTPTAAGIGSTPFSFHAGVAPSLDLAPSVPLGISAEYRFEFANESYGGAASGTSGAIRTVKHGVAAGVYYTGRRDLVLGAAFVGSFSSLTSDVGALAGSNLISGLVTTRYFF